AAPRPADTTVPAETPAPPRPAADAATTVPAGTSPTPPPAADAATSPPAATPRPAGTTVPAGTSPQPRPAADAATPPPAATAPAESPATPRPGEPTVTSVSPDIDLAQDASPLPGAHRGGFQRLPTAPVAVTVETAPAEPGGEFTPDDTSWQATDSAFHSGLAGWALAFAVVGLLVSMFVGWGFPIGLVAVVSAIIALRRPLENRAVAVWAIALGALSILYSAGWLLFTAMRANFFG
ncbi:hypothetical protein MRBLMI12_004328, partial [Microbacterium sp. LMI12-1-1.1]|uniref:hypothetical protein n=1 Tax=Microbacterium sp. LMI12-1-1.1 TaxID=3135225 RepID=UPI00342D602A